MRKRGTFRDTKHRVEIDWAVEDLGSDILNTFFIQWFRAKTKYLCTAKLKIETV